MTEERSKKLRRVILPAIIVVFLIVLTVALYLFGVIPPISFDGDHFGIERYISQTDKDGDGIDDQTDILCGAREYVASEPEYKSKYYAGGRPDDGYGVCTDVVDRALLAAGYDLQVLVAADIAAAPDEYDVPEPDSNIDFRRVRNLSVYFERNVIPLTLDVSQTEEWQGGDIVIFEGHIGIVSDKRNLNGVPLVIHHASPYQVRYEMDILAEAGNIIGHYRIS